MTRVGAIVIGEGIDHWALAQEFIDNQKQDQFGLPAETRVVLHRETYIELHINPVKTLTTDGLNVASLKDWKG